MSASQEPLVKFPSKLAAKQLVIPFSIGINDWSLELNYFHNPKEPSKAVREWLLALAKFLGGSEAYVTIRCSDFKWYEVSSDSQDQRLEKEVAERMKPLGPKEHIRPVEILLRWTAEYQGPRIRVHDYDPESDGEHRRHLKIESVPNIPVNAPVIDLWFDVELWQGSSWISTTWRQMQPVAMPEADPNDNDSAEFANLVRPDNRDFLLFHRGNERHAVIVTPTGVHPVVSLTRSLQLGRVRLLTPLSKQSSQEGRHDFNRQKDTILQIKQQQNKEEEDFLPPITIFAIKDLRPYIVGMREEPRAEPMPVFNTNGPKTRKRPEGDLDLKFWRK